MLADDIQIDQKFDPEGENGGYSCEKVGTQMPAFRFKDWGKPVVVREHPIGNQVCDFSKTEARILESFKASKGERINRGYHHGAVTGRWSSKPVSRGELVECGIAVSQDQMVDDDPFEELDDTPSPKKTKTRRPKPLQASMTFKAREPKLDGPHMTPPDEEAVTARKRRRLEHKMRMAMRGQLDKQIRQSAAHLVASNIDPKQMRVNLTHCVLVGEEV